MTGVMFKRIAALALLSSAGISAQDARAPSPADPWQPLRFLIGTWEAKTEGGSAGAAGSGTYTFQLELRDHVLVRHSSAAGCKGPADFDCEHGDILYVYREGPGQPYRAIYFDNEGHVIRYLVTTPAPGTAIFLSDPSQPGPGYRLTYEIRQSAMHGKFQLRMPGQTEFRSYLEWSGEKK